jgi:monoamine oxidase
MNVLPPGSATTQGAKAKMSQATLDVAIVGGGVSGVYAAWRLLSEGRAQNVTVFEADDRIGGRLLSVEPPNMPHMTAELGGMRILPAVQPRIAALLERLNANPQGYEPIETFAFPVDEPDNIAYLRGVHMRLSTFTTQPSDIPYRLTFQEQGQSVGAILVRAIEQLVPGITQPSLTEAQRRAMTRDATLDGEPLYEMGFWEVLARVLSSEAYQLGTAAGGYQSVLSNWNAADAIPWFLSDFGVAPSYRGFKKGFQQVPLALAAQTMHAGGQICLNTRVHGVAWRDGIFELQLDSGDVVQARQLILAMPRRSLELLMPHSPLLQMPAVQRLIGSVTPRPLFKLFTTYREPWWLAAGVKSGRSVTDLPVRQTYYWPLETGEPALSGRSMLMASYDDGLNVSFWDGFRPKRGLLWLSSGAAPRTFDEADAGIAAATAGWQRYQAPPAMVAEVQRQLAELHGLKYVPHAVDAAFMDWGDDPYGGGWNSWNIGVRSWEVKEQIVQPVADVPLYVCGEAYSDAQGWVEGALQTADRLLERHFGIASFV